MSKSHENLPCFNGPCKYLGWKALVMHCRHPGHPVPIYPSRAFQIVAAAGKCKSHVDWEAKVMPGFAAKWPDPIDLKAYFATEVTEKGKI